MPTKRFDPRDLDWKAIWSHPLTIPGLLVFAGLILAFLPMISSLYGRWTEDEYYSHGFLVPFLSAFIIFRRWPKIQAIVGHREIDIPQTGFPLKMIVGGAVVLWTGVMGVVTYKAVKLAMGAAAGLPAGMVAALGGLLAALAVLAVFGAIYGAGISLANRIVGFQATALAIIVAMLPLVYASYLGNIIVLQSALFVVMSLLAIALVAGWRWALAISPAIAFLLFGLPVWNWIIDGYTNPLQLLSTEVAFQLLQITGFSPFQPDPTTIYLNHFTLNVAVPCSGMKLLLALSAFTTLFTLIANLKTWANVLMVLMIIPLCLLVNGLRIALIGIVGNEFGTAAGLQFHDTSGYITLVVCFFLLFKFARLLGWKD